MKRERRGGCAFRFAFLLILLSGAVTFFYPILQIRFPEETAFIERLRGAYHGPSYAPLPEGYTGFSGATDTVTITLGEGSQSFYLVPPDDLSYYVYALDQWGRDVTVEVYDSEGTLLDTNHNHRQFTGRAADMYSDMGVESDLSHAVGMDVALAEGRLYEVRVSPDDPETVGDTVEVAARVVDEAIEVPVLWGIFSASVFILTIVLLMLRYFLFLRPRQQNS